MSAISEPEKYARREGHKMFLRFCIIAMCFPGFPWAALEFGEWLKLPGLAKLAGVAFALVLWGLLSRRLLVKYRTKCPVCLGPNAFMEMERNEEANYYLKCPDCSFRATTG